MPHYPTTKVKTIKYNSPSGKININKWIPPFKEVEGGFGFVGVLAEDSKTGQLQCHVCGNWYELLTSHIWGKHQMLSADYSERFGLLRSTALKCMRIRKIQSKVMQEMRKSNSKYRYCFSKNNEAAANRKGKPKAVEAQNKFGVCDLQVRDRILLLKKKLGRTPALTEVIDEYGGGFAGIIHSRYSSYIKLVRDIGLTPVYSSFNPRFKNEKEWRNHLLDIGRKAIKKGKPLILKKMLPTNEQRYIYRYFKSFGHYKTTLLKTI